jgi:hypothetical protein
MWLENAQIDGLPPPDLGGRDPNPPVNDLTSQSKLSTFMNFSRFWSRPARPVTNLAGSMAQMYPRFRGASTVRTSTSPKLIMSGKGKGGRGKASAKATSKSAKAGLQFPVARVGRYLKKGKYATRVGAGAPVYLAAVLEHLFRLNAVL